VEKNDAELRCEAKEKLTNKRACELAPKYSLYGLRHSWATHALERGVDPLTVAILMGHKDPSMLAKVYQHLSLNPEHLAQSRAMVDGLETGSDAGVTGHAGAEFKVAAAYF
jgi:integrase